MRQDIRGPKLSRIEALTDKIQDLEIDARAWLNEIESMQFQIDTRQMRLFQSEQSLISIQDEIKMIRAELERLQGDTK